MEGRFIGRDIIDKPTCAFCGVKISPPEEDKAYTVQEMPVGSCACGAVYICDVTGHNLGTAMVEALVFACNGNWDLAWELLPDKDYEEKRIENYDLETHLIIHGGVYEGRRISGVLFFIRLHENVKGSSMEYAPGGSLGKPSEPFETPPLNLSGRLSKKDVEELVRKYNIDPIIEIAKQDTRILRYLKRLLYSVDPLMRKRTAEFIGKVAPEISKRSPETITRFLQGLFSSLSDSASSSWGYLDAIGEIISSSPDLYIGYIPRLFQFIKERSMLPEVLNAFNRISEARPELLRKNSFQFFGLLKDKDPVVRGYTAIFLGNLRATEAREDLEKLGHDSSKMEIYRNGKMEHVTVGQMAFEAIEKL